jgi:hypothetical protein
MVTIATLVTLETEPQLKLHINMGFNVLRDWRLSQTRAEGWAAITARPQGACPVRIEPIVDGSYLAEDSALTVWDPPSLHPSQMIGYEMQQACRRWRTRDTISSSAFCEARRRQTARMVVTPISTVRRRSVPRART